MKSLQFIYEDNAIQFLVNPGQDSVMINATEMAKVFGKRVDDFTRLSSTETFIQALIRDLNSENNHADVRDYNREDVINSSKKRGTYMHRILALRFAQWLDVDFELWVFKTVDSILFGHYKEHWDAHVRMVAAKERMSELRVELIDNGSKESAIEYFDLERQVNALKNRKTKAIRSQLSLFDTLKP